MENRDTSCSSCSVENTLLRLVPIDKTITGATRQICIPHNDTWRNRSVNVGQDLLQADMRRPSLTG